MRGSGRSGSSGVVYVLDASAIFVGIESAAYGVELVTTPGVVEEVLDPSSRGRLSTALRLGRVRVVDPGREWVSRAREAAKAVGEVHRLSRADLEVVALAMALARGRRVVVLTDDYGIQNVLKSLGLEFRPVKTRGIRRVVKRVVKCPRCGAVLRGDEEVCPVCGYRFSTS